MHSCVRLGTHLCVYFAGVIVHLNFLKRAFNFFLWHFNARTQRVYLSLHHMNVAGQETPIYLSVCRLISLPHSAGYYDSIVERLSKLAQTTLSTALSHRGRDDNALLKYDTLPWHHTPAMYIPLCITARHIYF